RRLMFERGVVGLPILRRRALLTDIRAHPGHPGQTAEVADRSFDARVLVLRSVVPHRQQVPAGVDHAALELSGGDKRTARCQKQDRDDQIAKCGLHGLKSSQGNFVSCGSVSLSTSATDQSVIAATANGTNRS